MYIYKGYGWVGWKNGQKPVSIKFTFNSTVHVNNITVAVLHNPDLGIQVNASFLPVYFTLYLYTYLDSVQCTYNQRNLYYFYIT